jgi:hypothetical protein
MSATVELRHVVVGADGHVVVPKAVKEVEGRTFVHLCGLDFPLMRILGCEGGRKLIEHLQRQRNDVVNGLLNPADEAQALEGLGEGEKAVPLRGKKRKNALGSLPPMVTASLGDMQVHVLSGLSKDPVWVELSSGNVAAMQAYIKKDEEDQEEAQGAKKKHIAWDAARQAYKVRVGGSQKWFSTHKHSDALAAAEAYLAEQTSRFLTTG